MSNIFYNPKYKTKQIFDLTSEPTDTPAENEIFFWLTQDGGSIYANYKLHGEPNTLTYLVADINTFDPSATIAGKVDTIEWDTDTDTLEYVAGSTSRTVHLSGLLKNASLSGNTLTFARCGINASDIVVDLSHVGRHMTSCTVDTQNKTLTFSYSDNATPTTVSLSSLFTNYYGGSTQSAEVSVAADGKITANVAISQKTGNMLILENDGLYALAGDGIDLSTYATKTDLSGKVDKVDGKGLSTNDFTTSLKNKLDSIEIGTAPCQTIQFSSSTTGRTDFWWVEGGIARFIHAMNCHPLVTFFDGNGETVLLDIKVESASAFEVDFKDRGNVTGTWTCIIHYGAPYQQQ